MKTQLAIADYEGGRWRKYTFPAGMVWRSDETVTIDQEEKDTIRVSWQDEDGKSQSITLVPDENANASPKFREITKTH